MAASDIWLREIVYRLRAVVNTLAAQVSGLSTGVAPSGDAIAWMPDVATFQAATEESLPNTVVLLLVDGHGNAGVFKYDDESSDGHNGTSVIVDASGRRWLRQQAAI